MDVIGMIDSLGGAVAAVGGDVKPFIDDSIAHKYENEAKERSNKFLSILSELNTDKFPDDANNFVLKLLADCGETCGGVGENRSIPLDEITSLINIAIKYIRQNSEFSSIQFKK